MEDGAEAGEEGSAVGNVYTCDLRACYGALTVESACAAVAESYSADKTTILVLVP